MIRHSPAELYIKFLLVHPDRLTNEQVLARLVEDQIDLLGKGYLDSLRKTAVPPVPFYPYEVKHTPSHRFIVKHKLTKLFFPDCHVKAAQEILRTPRAKEYIETMLLSKAPVLAIAARVAKDYGIPCSGKAVQMYKVFYMDVDRLDSTEMRAALYLRHNPVLEGRSGEEAQIHAAALKKASYDDPRRVAASLPSSPISAAIAAVKLGHMPSKLDLAGALVAAQTLAILRSVEAAQRGGIQDALSAAQWTMMAKNNQEMLDSIVTPDAALRDQLSALLLKTDPSSIPLLKELPGQHTVELQPRRDNERDAKNQAGD